MKIPRIERKARLIWERERVRPPEERLPPWALFEYKNDLSDANHPWQFVTKIKSSREIALNRKEYGGCEKRIFISKYGYDPEDLPIGIARDPARWHKEYNSIIPKLVEKQRKKKG